VIVAEHDEIIGPTHSDRLIAGFAERRPIVATIPGAGHNDLQEHPAYADALSDFLQ
jgi:pimeloyl-ACP methyl ester carboxylesterase